MARKRLLHLPALALAAGLLAGGLALLAPTPIAAGEAATESNAVAPGQTEREKARVVADLLDRYHYREPEESDELFERAADAYLRQLDHGRFFLLEPDVERFREDMAERAADPDEALEAAYDLHARYRERVGEQIESALGLLEGEGELGLEAEGRYEQDRSEADWAGSADELDRVWRQRVAHDALTLELAGRETDEIRDNLRQRYETMRERALDVENDDIMEIYLTAWASAFDPHSAFMSPQRTEEFDMQMSLQLEGIGAKLTMEQDFTEIVELIPGGPAEQSGELSEGERIIGVADGADGEMKDVVGWRLNEIVQMIRGPEDSVVRLKVLPPAGASDNTPREVELVRSQIDLEDQAAQKEIIEHTRADGETDRIGVIEIPQFYRDFSAAQAGEGDYRSTTRDVQRLLGELLDEGIDGLLIDLRGNSGGALQEATALTALFTDGGPAVQVRSHDGHLESVGDPDQPVAYDGPLGVLVDRRSASASEIFAAAIQDYGRGVVLGDQTFGKGTVQQMIDLDHYAIPEEERSGQLKLTIAQFYRVSGESTQLDGVTPDINLPSAFDHEDFGERAAHNPMPATRIEGLDVPVRHDLDGVIDELRQRHEARMGEDEAFRTFQRELELQRELRQDTSMALDRETRRAEQDEREQRLLEHHNERRIAHGLEPVEAYEDIDEDALPDVPREAGAAVVSDLRHLLAEVEGELAEREEEAVAP